MRLINTIIISGLKSGKIYCVTEVNARVLLLIILRRVASRHRKHTQTVKISLYLYRITVSDFTAALRFANLLQFDVTNVYLCTLKPSPATCETRIVGLKFIARKIELVVADYSISNAPQLKPN